MPIDFSPARWDDLCDSYSRWWQGELKRPLIHIYGPPRDPGRPEPDLPARHFTAAYPDSVSAEQIVDRWDYDLSCLTFLGDAFPHAWPNFGPGVLAVFLGARPEPQENTVWYYPPREQPIDALDLSQDFPDHPWARRIEAIIAAAVERWQGQVQLGSTDLGGNLDVLSTFRPGEGLLFDLVEAPEAVKRVTWQAHEKWWKYFDHFNSMQRPPNPGYSAWAPIFSTTPYYMLQCDFAYMIGPDMFAEFVLPELAATCRKLDNAFYHLDGIGQLAHLDHLLSIPELKGVQWVPGDGQPTWEHWPRVYRKIRDAGKLVQFSGNLHTLDRIATDLGSAEGLILCSGARCTQAELDDCLRKWGG